METYLGYCDESGDHGIRKPKSSSNSYFIRSLVQLSHNDSIEVCGIIDRLYKKHGIDLNHEVKWNWLYILSTENISQKILKRYPGISNYTYKQIITFVQDIFSSIKNINYKLFFTLDDKSTYKNIDYMEKFHLEEIMARFFFDCQANKSLGLLRFDNISPKENKEIKNCYKTLKKGNKYGYSYRSLDEDITFHDSKDNRCIQLADFCAGIFKNYVCRYQSSINFFISFLYPKLRSGNGKGPIGNAIRVVPNRNEELNKYLRSILKEDKLI